MTSKTSIIVTAGIIVLVALGAVWFIRGRDRREETPGVLVDTSSGAVAPLHNDQPITTPPPMHTIKNRMHEITLKTNFGDIAFETFDKDAPHTVKNFIILAEKNFYDNLTFHRVISAFMIQGGDPNGNGTGGPGYKFDDELNADSESAKLGYQRGIVAMANAGPNTNGSQFFIMHQTVPLPHNYTIFGAVTRGIETVDAIAKTKTDGNDTPLSPVVIKDVSVISK